MIGENKCFTLATNPIEAVCYAVDSHPQDSRFKLEGGGSTNIVRKDSQRLR